MKTKDFLKKQHKEPNAIHYKGKRKNSHPKANHKHVYRNCLVTCIGTDPIDTNKTVEHCYRAQYCTICGKLTNLKFFETARSEYGTRLLLSLSTSEMQKQYPDFPTFSVNSIWKDKFVQIDDDGQN